MHLDTKYFGRIDYDPSAVVHFPSGLFGFAEEKERRKTASQMRRRAYKREKNREYREAYSMRVTPDTMRREHEIAVMLLSHER